MTILIGGLLLAYGIGGIVGNFVGGARAAGRTKPAVLGIVGLLAASMLALLVTPASPRAAVVALVIRGAALLFGASLVAAGFLLITFLDRPRA